MSDLVMQRTISVLEHVTPFKICVMLLIQEYCLMKTTGKGKNQTKRVLFGSHMRPELKRDFCMLALHLTQSKDMDYSKLMQTLETGTYRLQGELLTNFTRRLSVVLDQDVGCLFDIFSGMDILTDYAPFSDPMTRASHSDLYKSSKIGIYMRRIRLFFGKLSFDETVKVYRDLQDYLRSNKTRTNDSRVDDESRVLESQSESQANMDLDMSMSRGEVTLDVSLHESSQRGAEHEGLWSKQQVDVFVSEQAGLLVSEPTLALAPHQLQSTIHRILTTSNEHVDAHYLSYLNCVRSKELNGAFNSLYHYFDRKRYPSIGEDDRKVYRLASLNLAILHTIFNRRKEALCALNEAVTLAHEANDSTTLQYCQTWLHILNNESRESMFERCLSKCQELNLGYLLSFTYQAYAQASHNLYGHPAQIFQLISKSDSGEGARELSIIQHAALWCLYGQPYLAALCAQRSLCLSSPTSPTVPIALSILIQQLAMRGEYEEGARVLEEGKVLRGSSCPTSSAVADSLASPGDWLVLCEGLLIYSEAIHRGQWQEATRAIKLISLVDPIESTLRTCEIKLAKGDRKGAAKFARYVLSNVKTSPVSRVKALRLLAYCDPASAALCLSKALTLSAANFLHFYTNLIYFDLLARQVEFGRGRLDIDSWGVLSSCSYSHVCDCLVIHAKAKILAAVGSPSFHADIASSIRILDRAQHFARALHDYARLKSISYLQAQLSDKISLISDRNKYSFQFRTLDEQFPSYNGSLFF